MNPNLELLETPATCNLQPSTCNPQSSAPTPPPTPHSIHLPVIEPWPDPVDGPELLTQVSGRYTNYIVLPTGAADRLFSSTLVASLRALPDRPWSIHGETHPTEPQPLTEHSLARRLRTFGVRPHNIRIGDVRAKGYDLAEFAPAFVHFLNAHPATA
jgi:hypothetical protein